tara:strand:+ start:388 stop:624 length:237 start_codon:yes stop_codon:yes gene_type:complete
MSSDAKSDMTASEMTIRKFLKQLGVTGHQKLTDAMDDAVRSGIVSSGNELPVTATIEIGTLKFSHIVTASLKAPDVDG